MPNSNFDAEFSRAQLKRARFERDCEAHERAMKRAGANQWRDKEAENEREMEKLQRELKR